MADERLRRLERAAATGDDRARTRLFHARHALDLCTICGKKVDRQPSCIFDRPYTCSDCKLESVKARVEHYRRTGRDTPEQERLAAWCKKVGLP